MSNWT